MNPAPPLFSSPFSGNLVEPESGRTEYVVLYLHGRGGSADADMGVPLRLARDCPHTAFCVLDGLLTDPGQEGGRCWWPPVPGLELHWLFHEPAHVPEHQQAQVQESAIRCRQAGKALNEFFDHLLSVFGLPASRGAIVGVAEGAMVLWPWLYRRPPDACPAAFAALAGPATGDDRALFSDPQASLTSLPPTALVAGSGDQLVPPWASDAVAYFLSRRGCTVHKEIHPGEAHWQCDWNGAAATVRFLQEHLLRGAAS